MPSSARIDELKKKFDENPRRYFAPLANEYRKAGDVAEAIRLCRAHLPQQPGHMSGHIVFGQALFEAQELDEARTVFEAALALDPENLIALRHLGDIAKGNGDTAGARGWYQRVLDADPRNEDIAAQMASLDAMPDAPSTDAVPAPSASDDGGISGWGDINPENEAARAAPTAAEPPAMDIEATTLVIDPPRPGRWTSRAPQISPAGSDRKGELPSGAAMSDAADEAFAAFDHTSEIDTTSLSFDELPPEIVPSAPAVPPASISDAEALFADSPFTGAMDVEPMDAVAPGHPANDLGLEVMEFVPPVRTPRAQPEIQPMLGQMLDENAPPSETPAAFVTETMAELYLQQGFQQEALDVYRQLLERSPDDESLKDRVHQLEMGSRSSISLAAISDTVIDAARKRQATPSGRSIRSFFGALAGRRAPHRPDGTPSGGQSVVPGDPAFDIADHPAPRAAALWEGAGSVSSAEAIDDLAWGDTPVATDEAEWVPDAPSEPGADRQAADAGLDAGPGAATDAGEAPQSSAADTREGSVDSLFGSASVPSGDDSAAATLAGVFTAGTPDASGDLPGRPTRAASTELSLDHVFRDMPRKVEPRRTTGGFSFDQFFADSVGGTGGAPTDDDGGTDPGTRGATRPHGDAPGNDIEQFNAWLDGLKKK